MMNYRSKSNISISMSTNTLNIFQVYRIFGYFWRCDGFIMEWILHANCLSGPWFNIKMSSYYQYRKSHCGDKNTTLESRLFTQQRKHQSSVLLAFVMWPVNSPHKRVSNAENVSIWWRHHDLLAILKHTVYVGVVLSDSNVVFYWIVWLRDFFVIQFYWHTHGCNFANANWYRRPFKWRHRKMILIKNQW